MCLLGVQVFGRLRRTAICWEGALEALRWVERVGG